MNISNSLVTVFDRAITEHIGDDFCDNSRILTALKVAGIFLLLAKIIIPFIIIALGTMDLFKAVQGGDNSAMSKSGKALGVRILVGLVIFFVPTIIDAILSGTTLYTDITSDFYKCSSCLLKPTSCDPGQVQNSTSINGGGSGGSGGSSGSQQHYLPSNGSCNTLGANAECTKYTGCEVRAYGNSVQCVRKCGTYGASDCPTDRCKVGNNAHCINK